MKTTKNIDELKINSNPVLRWVLLITGTILMGIGILGMFLPLLPTTIFFILAAWCYARSSEKIYNWLHHNKFFGKYLSNYRRGNGMTILSKTISLSMLWSGIGYS
ncbi:MAG: YbaN family protein, partial [Ignavibacteria bacterium]